MTLCQVVSGGRQRQIYGAHPAFILGSVLVSCGGALSTGCGCVLHGSVGCVPPLDTPLGLSPGARGAPKRGMPTGSEAFLELPIALGYDPATGPTLNTALCHIRTLVGRRINTAHTRLLSWVAFFCETAGGALIDRLWLRAAQFGRVCSTTGYITSGLRGPSPQALTLFGGAGFIARAWGAPKRGMPTGSEAFLECLSRWANRPFDRLKNGLVS